ncbi:MAG: hypothetical protein DMG68_07260 [Acidobacteria bacterium]|nr:MAG: hypothetical protein DMG68_07260 [Acidobacteriota bacterium]
MKCFAVVLLVCSFLACGNPAAPGAPSMVNNPSSQTPSAPSPTPAATVTYDMLAWMTMDPSLSGAHHMSGTANPLYTSVQSSRFFWTKTGQGFPWDVQLYDNNYIYLWVTELDWANDRTYKVFHSQNPALGNYNMPFAPRVITAAAHAAPGRLASIQVQDSTYEIHSDCNTFVTKSLGHVVNEVWGPYQESLGGDLPNNLQTLVISYRYSCDSTYSNCMDKEEFHVAKPYGLVKWQHERLQSNGTYAPPDNVTYFNKVVAGQTRIVTACF